MLILKFIIQNMNSFLKQQKWKPIKCLMISTYNVKGFTSL